MINLVLLLDGTAFIGETTWGTGGGIALLTENVILCIFGFPHSPQNDIQFNECGNITKFITTQ